jgi:arginine/lysine/histidine/glutamine transport system substrate-binding and permease protein
MHKRTFVFLLVFVMMLAAVVPATATNTAPNPEGESQVVGEVIRVGTDAAYPPFEELDEDGNFVGFDIDLMNAIAEDAGFEVEFINAPFDTIFTALSEGEFDAVISASTITEEREEIVDFSDPYFVASQAISVRIEDEEDIAGPEDLVGLRIGVQLGTTGDAYATDELEGVEISRFDTAPLAFQALGQGDVDAVIVDTPTSEEILATTPELEATIVGEPLTEEFYGIAVREDFPELLEAINLSLENVIEDGVYAEIFEEWFDVPPSEDFLPSEDDMDMDDEDMDDMDDEDMDDMSDDDMDDMDDDDMDDEDDDMATEEPSDS